MQRTPLVVVGAKRSSGFGASRGGGSVPAPLSGEARCQDALSQPGGRELSIAIHMIPGSPGQRLLRLPCLSGISSVREAWSRPDPKIFLWFFFSALPSPRHSLCASMVNWTADRVTARRGCAGCRPFITCRATQLDEPGRYPSAIDQVRAAKREGKPGKEHEGQYIVIKPPAECPDSRVHMPRSLPSTPTSILPNCYAAVCLSLLELQTRTGIYHDLSSLQRGGSNPWHPTCC